MKFIAYVAETGLINKKTARNWRSAIGQILKNVSPEAEADVRQIDVEAELRRVINRATNKMSPDTMKRYLQRVERAIEEFITFRSNPAGYKPKAATRERAKSPDKPKQKRGGSVSSTTHSKDQNLEVKSSAVSAEINDSTNEISTMTSITMNFSATNGFPCSSSCPARSNC